MVDFDKVSGGTVAKKGVLPSLRGIIKYKDAAGVMQIIEAASNLEDAVAIKNELERIATILKDKGLKVESCDVIDTMETIGGGKHGRTGMAWGGPYKMKAIVRRNNVAGQSNAMMSPICESYDDVINYLESIDIPLGSVLIASDAGLLDDDFCSLISPKVVSAHGGRVKDLPAIK